MEERNRSQREKLLYLLLIYSTTINIRMMRNVPGPSADVKNATP